MKVWPIVAAIFFLSGSIHAQNAQITYKFTNTQVLDENAFSGDILIERSNGTADLIPFLAEGTSITAGGSPFVPPVTSGYASGLVTYDPPRPGDPPPPTQPQVGLL